MDAPWAVPMNSEGYGASPMGPKASSQFSLPLPSGLNCHMDSGGTLTIRTLPSAELDPFASETSPPNRYTESCVWLHHKVSRFSGTQSPGLVVWISSIVEFIHDLGILRPRVEFSATAWTHKPDDQILEVRARIAHEESRTLTRS